ncbi:MAG: DUF664 domain-containing protein [Planctomycetes bacterium]|nr:DUF664 domain-containing protein [Planctomycetota bacterium]
MIYDFLVETCRTEIEKTLSVWAMFAGEDLLERPCVGDRRGRSLLEHMVHQCQSENAWFEKMLGIRVRGAVLPPQETLAGFVAAYAAAARERLLALSARPPAWWQEEVTFFDQRRSRAWIVVRRIAHTAHHRGQQTALLRARGTALHSTYGPTADTGGLGPDGAAVIYPLRDPQALLEGRVDGRMQPLPPPVERPVTERPDASG